MSKLVNLLEAYPNVNVDNVSLEAANQLISAAIDEAQDELEHISSPAFDFANSIYTSVSEKLGDLDDSEDLQLRDLIAKAVGSAIQQQLSVG